MKKIFSILATVVLGTVIAGSMAVEAKAQAQCPCAIFIETEAYCTQNGVRNLQARLREAQLENAHTGYVTTFNMEPNACFAGWEQNYTNSGNGFVCQIHETYTGQCS